MFSYVFSISLQDIAFSDITSREQLIGRRTEQGDIALIYDTKPEIS
jgi:hypothetical protein